jgi:GNAT superfamily N-acetyltransferase
VTVRRSHQGRSIGRFLYERFESIARERGCTKLKAITPPVNRDSIAFHQRMGFRLMGEQGEEGFPIVRDYFAPGVPRVIFEKELS